MCCNHKWLSPHHDRDVAGLPLVIVEKEVLIVLETKQCGGEKGIGGRVFGEKNGVARLNISELDGIGHDVHHSIAERLTAIF